MGLKIDRRATKITKLIGIAVLAFVIICIIKLFIWEKIYYQNKGAEPRTPEQAVITDLADANNPSEDVISQKEYSDHQVNAIFPRYLEIPRLEVKARVFSGELDSYIMPVPENIHDVTWYSGSGNPGQGGNILISGISKSDTNDGAFANLDSLEKGDELILENGEGQRFSYEIKEIQIIDKDEAKEKLSTAQRRIDDKETLALITAHKKDENSKNFNSIIIVRATLKNS